MSPNAKDKLRKFRFHALFAVTLGLLFTSVGRCDEPLFETDVLPLLTKRCLGCHGGLRKKGKLDLRTIPAMLAGGRSGAAVISGNVKESHIWDRIAADEMPPGKDKMPAAEKTVIKQWIAAKMPTVAQQRKNVEPLLPAGKKHSPKQVAAAIDKHVDRFLASAKLKAAPKCDDATFLRRVYLDLTGRVPTAKQAIAFLDSSEPNKRAKLIDTVLATPEFGEQFGRTWREWICPPELPSDANGGRQPHREAQELGKWLGKRFTNGDSWDKITRDILTVEGDLRKNPQAIFFGLVGEGGKATASGSARAVGSLFMGVQLQCAECHDDPFRTWAQQEFWGMAAFFETTKGDFRKVSEMPGRGSKNLPEVTIPRSAFVNAGKKVSANFLKGKKYEAKNNRELRSHFVHWLTQKDNPYFAKAFANRMWFYLFSRGIVHPVDDIRDLNPASHPGLLKLLENEFAASGFDIKHLIRCICNSETYQRTSRVKRGTDLQTIPALNHAFGRMPLRIMTADVLYSSLKLAYGDSRLDLRAINPKDGNTNGESAPVKDAYLEFLRMFGTNEEDATDFTHGIPQMLAMINHPRLLAGSRALDEFRKTKPAPTPKKIVEWLYLSTLSRRPTNDEMNEAVGYIQRTADKEKAYNGVLWMLVNRSEYIFVR